MMKQRLLAVLLLLAALPALAEKGPAPAKASPEPPIVEATACFTGAPMTPAKLEAEPLFGVSEVETSTQTTLACITCREFVPTCRKPKQDAGKVCGDGNPPDTCTCKTCNGTFGCFP